MSGVQPAKRAAPVSVSRVLSMIATHGSVGGGIASGIVESGIEAEGSKPFF
jgi:hypothetical protein